MNNPEGDPNLEKEANPEPSSVISPICKYSFSRSPLEKIPSKIGDIDHETIEIAITVRKDSTMDREQDKNQQGISTKNEITPHSVLQQADNNNQEGNNNHGQEIFSQNPISSNEGVLADNIGNDEAITGSNNQHEIENNADGQPNVLSESDNLYSVESVHEGENPNENEGPIDLENPPTGAPVIGPQQNQNNRDYSFRLRSHLEFYIFTLGMYILSLTTINKKTTYYGLFVFFWIFVIVQLYRVIKFKYPATFTARQRRRKYFVFIEWMLLGAFLIAGFLRVRGVKFTLSIFAVTGYINSLLHCILTDASLTYAKKTQVIVERMLLWTQVMLIALKADHILSSWSASFSLAYYVLFGFIFYSILAFFVFISSLFSSHREEISYKLNLVGSCWYFLISLYSWIWFSILIGLSDYLDKDRSSKPLSLGFYAGIAHSVLVTVYAIVFRKLLCQFLRYELIEYGIRRRADRKKLEKMIRFEEIEEETPYLIIVSPSFYTYMKDILKAQTKAQIDSWKEEIRKFKNKKHTSVKESSAKDQTSKDSNNQKVDINDLKIQISEDKLNNLKKIRGLAKNNSFIDVPGAHQISESNNSKLCYSLDDIDIVDKVKKPKEEGEKIDPDADTDKLCYICFERPPSAVIIKCGHGGLCYECAIENWRKQDKCAICRQPIENILKVNVFEKMKISKVIHGTKKILDDKEIAQ
jgi:hypothetical protein